MSNKIKTIYICSSCGFESPIWQGQCGGCGEWNTLVEDVIIQTKSSINNSISRAGKNISSTSNNSGQRSKPVHLSDVSIEAPKRVSSKITEFDRVLGGGFVPGQVILLTGEPGIGKSTILTEIAKKLGQHETANTDVLYVCGEESPDQIKVRATRMKYDAKNLLMLSETNVESIMATLESTPNIGLIIVDSVQTVYSDQLSGMAGSMTQIKGCTQLLTATAKNINVPMVLVGHVTKEGTVAGPKLLEHIVDTVLYLEGDSQHLYRILRTTKNRFGPVSEVGIFQMEDSGIVEVANPSELFLEQSTNFASGSCITVIMEGYRPILFEVQALTVKTSFGYPRRTTSGFNTNRLQVLLAILEKRTGLNLSGHDVYLSVAGGFKISEYSADLAVCLAIISSLKDKPLKEKTVVFGECGLSGEIRKVSHAEKRAKEAKKLGFTNVISPDNVKTLRQALKLGFEQ